jgi:hypothetical protein
VPTCYFRHNRFAVVVPAPPSKGSYFSSKSEEDRCLLFVGSARAALALVLTLVLAIGKTCASCTAEEVALTPPGPPVPLLLSSRSPTALHYMHVTFVASLAVRGSSFFSLSLFMLIISLPPLQSGLFLFDFAHFEFN